ncbi:Diacylglycerol kinase [Phycisphaerales bacterium]|nr:Diacylglycerol kinase [Phycisphaerales bacterium]
MANPKSGRGRALSILSDSLRLLREHGHEPTHIPLAPVPSLADALSGEDAVAAIGGDGTVHSLLPALRGSRTALYHAPLGTENLFAREFFFRPDASEIVASVGAGATRAVDLAVLAAGGREIPFAVMCSVGPDAGVIRRLHAARRGPITHASYIGPIAAEVLRPSIPRLTIEVDGQRVVREQPGIAVIANMRQYAMRIDPAADADPSDGLLDIVFMPCETGLQALARTIDARRRDHRADVIRIRAGQVRLVSHTPDTSAQADGELILPTDGPLDVSICVEPASLRVLLPA